MTAELHLGAYRGRDPHLFRFSRGVIANPMERPESSKIALATVADYLWDPVGYDPEASWRAAAVDVAGPPTPTRCCCSPTTCAPPASRRPTPTGSARCSNGSSSPSSSGDPATAWAELRALADEFLAAADHLLGPDATNQVLTAELRPWLSKFRAGVAAAGRGRSSAVVPASATQFGAAAEPAVFGDVLDMFVRGRQAH